MAKKNSINLDATKNADGFDLSGGTTVRKITVTGGNVTLAGGGAAVVTFPTSTSTLATLALSETFTNKTMTGTNNVITASLLKTATTEVSVSGASAPSNGQVLTATSSTTATWQTPSGGGGGGLTQGQLLAQIINPTI